MRVPVIAVVEYDPAMRLLIDEMLSELGYEARLWLGDGQPWEFIQHVQPDLILLDLWLQRRGDGWKLLNQLWSAPVASHIPVIVCTGDVQMLQERESLLQLNQCATLTKPFTVEDLQATISHQLGSMRGPTVDVIAPQRLPANLHRLMDLAY